MPAQHLQRPNLTLPLLMLMRSARSRRPQETRLWNSQPTQRLRSQLMCLLPSLPLLRSSSLRPRLPSRNLQSRIRLKQPSLTGLLLPPASLRRLLQSSPSPLLFPLKLLKLLPLRPRPRLLMLRPPPPEMQRLHQSRNLKQLPSQRRQLRHPDPDPDSDTDPLCTISVNASQLANMFHSSYHLLSIQHAP